MSWTPKEIIVLILVLAVAFSFVGRVVLVMIYPEHTSEKGLEVIANIITFIVGGVFGWLAGDKPKGDK